VEYAAMKLMIGTDILFTLFPCLEVNVLFDPGTGVVVQIGNGHMGLGTPK
jgi:hypothetical protein